ncbi:phenylacetate--CoA ligase family protein [Zunongwangia sp. HGR-M22]|uniref:phenylacetate--CoA ligase family protein n=1 Tax=Zunongwangia sp. HGR-M22 TaxID=3015168 RepID=UPI0022DD39D4|nr:phenylacetate--CoA ligase family protein [Zunongwangia sp. HGR-M22]WBL25657.1 phenylacetate--CoA ligase family protein [Zunongwangia sp. HGR-M22]
MDWFKLSLQFNKFPVNRARKILDDIQKIPEEDYQNFVEKKKREIVEFHLRNNNFYKDFIGDRSIENWEDIPVMTKKDLQIPLNNRLSKGFNLKNTYIGKTSGSSGHPFTFAKDRLCHAMAWEGFNDHYNWHGIDLNKSLQARFYGIPLDFYGNLQERIKDRISLRRRFTIFDLSDAKLQSFLNRFKKSNFNYINGYTSAILLFAKFLQKKEIVLKNICPSLKLCIVTSERLFDKDKEIIEKAIGVTVINEYGASEVGLIAFENQKREWCLNSKDLYIEIVDQNNKTLPVGQEGKVIITSLYNRAHPIIRYAIGDIGILDEKSTTKKPILKSLIGRTSDVAKLANGKVVPGLTFYYVTKTIIDDAGSTKEFVITQTDIDTFEIEYVRENDFEEEEIAKIADAVEKYVGKNLNVNFKRKHMLNRTKSGKLKQFTSLVD